MPEVNKYNIDIFLNNQIEDKEPDHRINIRYTIFAGSLKDFTERLRGILETLEVVSECQIKSVTYEKI